MNPASPWRGGLCLPPGTHALCALSVGQRGLRVGGEESGEGPGQGVEGKRLMLSRQRKWSLPVSWALAHLPFICPLVRSPWLRG